MPVSVSLHLDPDRWWATIKDPFGNGSIAWLEVSDGENSIALFGNRGAFEMLASTVTGYLERHKPTPSTPS